MKHIFYIALFISGYFFGQVPGGVSGPSLWFKTTVNGSNDLILKDYSKRNQVIFTPTSQNKPKVSLFNYNESMELDGDDYLRIPFTVEDIVSMMIFTVENNRNPASESSIYATENGYEKELAYSTAQVISPEATMIYNTNTTGSPTTSKATLKTMVEYGVEAPTVQTIIGGNGVSIINIGKENTTNEWSHFKGQIPEFIIYKRALTESEKTRVETYLAVKYGFTLTKNYLSSRNQTIWDVATHTTFSHGIVGIGKDNSSGLEQKQSTSSEEQDGIILYVGELKAKNNDNTGNLSNLDFILTGHNGKAKTFSSTATSDGLKLLDKKWLTQASGNAHRLSTNIILNLGEQLAASPLKADETLWLVIDRQANNTYTGTDVEMIPMTSFSATGDALFSGLKWDTDNNSIDNWTIGRGPNLLMSMTIFQPVCATGGTSGGADLKVHGGTAPFNVKLKGGAGYTQENRFNGSTISFNNLAADTYTLELTDANAVKQTQQFTINKNASNLDLGNNRYLASAFEIIDASTLINEPGATYEWKNEQGEIISTNSKLMVGTAGTYQLTVTTAQGCQSVDTISFFKSIEDGIKIWPNPSKVNEGVHITATLPGIYDFNVKIYDMSGKLILISNHNGSDYYNLTFHIPHPGAYQVVIETAGEEISKKILVE